MRVRFKGIDQTHNSSIVVFAAEEGALLPSAERFDEETDGQLTRAAQAAEFDGKAGQIVEVLAPAGSDLPRILLVGLGDESALTRSKLEEIGGKIAQRCAGTVADLGLYVDAEEELREDGPERAVDLAFGICLGSYRFNKYRKETAEKKKTKIKTLSVFVEEPTKVRSAFRRRQALFEGVSFARDLTNEPANILTPANFAERVSALADLGVEIDILDRPAMAKLKMDALLGVSLGSENEPRIAVMRWNGGRKNRAPLALIGKGVTFDTGGISLKPGPGMGDMKGDMAGAAAVAGTMHALAARKAKANVVGLIGLVENMPDGKAQRPGDVVTSMSGQTIEILNTDAEGRLVLCDVMWYAQQKYKPSAMIDLATLTGAIIVGLGYENAGLFSDDDMLAENLIAAGHVSGETVWRMPLGPAYDRMIDSKVADMQNIGNKPAAGSVTAAQFLKRYTNGVPWAHLDIAGTAWAPSPGGITPSWGTGFGVRLLDTLVSDFYEGTGK